jgi:prolipoprotein diacylglyceryl transferase
MVASIPSPGSNTLGPFHMYGLMIAIGVIAAVELSRARWRARGGDPDDVYAIAFWAVPAGLIGARLYHVATDWRTYQHHWMNALKIWNGGLGIPGGIALGVVVGVWVARRRGIRLSPILDAVVPALPLAQAIGRLGNWWNQELFGRPTSLPWGVRIDVNHRPLQYIASSTFQPTFLYEMLWNLALCGLLIWIDRKRVMRPGNVLPLYVGAYFLGRIWIEALRSDFASTIGPFRVFFVRGFRRRPSDSDDPYLDGHRFSTDADTESDAPAPDAHVSDNEEKDHSNGTV